ncbi:uncharacterized protein OCT59_025010 [Rhizophagus irregularis]|nr:hypothetical protein OCT59_025010 [Rhizophagus irregularis]CAG8468333.1 10248_t:CDS:2 [Rhizophagus irregularis]
MNLNRPATLNLGMSQRFAVNYRNMAQNGQSEGQNSISLTAILTNPIQQNTRMSINYILTHDRDMRMTIYYITI